MLLLAVLVVFAWPSQYDHHRLAGAARAGQAAFRSARALATGRGEPHGVRLLRDLVDPTTANGFALVRQRQIGSYADQGTVTIERRDADGDGVADSPDAVVVRGDQTNWWLLKDRGALANDDEIWLLGRPYRIDVSLLGPASETLLIRPPFVDAVARTSTPPLPTDEPWTRIVAYPPRQPYRLRPVSLELLPQSETISLPSGVVVDIAYSQVGGDDLLYGATGRIVGRAEPAYLLLRDVRDAGKPVAAAEYRQLVLAVQPDGSSAAYEVDPADPWRFAKTGISVPD